MHQYAEKTCAAREVAQAAPEQTTVSTTRLLETFAVLADFLGIDCTEARTMSGKPSDVLIAAIERKITDRAAQEGK